MIIFPKSISKIISFLVLLSCINHISAYGQFLRPKAKHGNPYRSNYQRLSSTGSHTLEVRNGQLWATGANYDGMLGDGTTINRSAPVQIGIVTNWVGVATGESHSLGLRADGTLWAWGDNAYGQVGDGTFVDKLSPVQIGTSSTWKGIFTGWGFSFAIRSDGTLWAWGRNSGGQLGDGSTTNRNAPVQIGTDSDWTEIDGSFDFTLAVKTNGTLWSWGQNSNGSLGDGSGTSRLIPGQVGIGTDWISISCGLSHSMGLKANGSLWTWGSNQFNQIGDGTTINRAMPVQINSGTQWVEISGGSQQSFAISSSGNLWGWGMNNLGQLGDGTITNRSIPVQIGIDNMWVEICGANSGAIALKANGTVWGWGYNGNGEIGDGTFSQRLNPVQVSSIASQWVTLSSGGGHNLAIKADGTLWSWGFNTYGQLGDGTTINRNVPIQVGTGTNWVSVSTGAWFSFGIRSDGTLWSWGYNFRGNLGDGTTIARSNPTQVGIGNNWVAVSAGGEHTLAIRSDGTLWACGYNLFGQLGDGTTTQRNSFIQIGLNNDWVNISAGGAHSFGIRANGTLWAWGGNDVGQLGDGTLTFRYSPVQVGIANNWINVSTGRGSHTAATRSNGTLWCWGRNNFGQVGDGSTTDRNTPIQIGSNTDWINVSAENNQTMGFRSNGGLWTWGRNANGQLGDGTLLNKVSPSFVASEIDITQVEAGSDFSGIIKANRNQICLTGDNVFGSLGNGNNTQSTSFVCWSNLVSNTIITAALGNSNYCAGSSLNVSYSISGIFTAGNVFTAQLSNSSGSFATPVNIGSVSSTTATVISALIPVGTASGTGYRIRVISSLPSISGTDNGTNFTVNTCVPTITSLGGTSFCPGATLTINYNVSGTLQAGNIFTAQLSNASGSFASPVNIGSTNSSVSGSISAVIPGGTSNGTGYRIRIVSSSPANNGPDNGSNLSVITCNTINIDTMGYPSLCAGGYFGFNLTFNTSGVFNAGNVFSVQLSNASGNFTTPTVISTLNSTVAAPITSYIPLSTLPGAGYRFRIVSSNPAVIGTDNGTDLTIINCGGVPAISSISPIASPFGTQLIITGTNLDPTQTPYQVFVGGARATISSGSSTLLTVNVSTGDVFQPVSVTRNGLTGYSAASHILTFGCGTGSLFGNDSFEPFFNLPTPSKTMKVTMANTVSIARNNSALGPITFAPTFELATGNGPFALTTADIDGDGYQDLIVTNSISNTISVFRNTSFSGSFITFETRLDFPTGNFPQGITVADFNSDGKPDIAAACLNSFAVSVLLNTSQGSTISFAPHVTFPTNDASDVSSADIDQDGKPDLAVSNITSNNVSVLKNNSSGSTLSFAPKIDLATGSFSSSVTLGDIDGDGKLDMAVTNQQSNNFSVFRNTSSLGTISFSPKVDYSTGVGPTSAPLSDLDGDGKPEIVISNAFEPNISVFKNNSSPGNILFSPRVNFVTDFQPRNIFSGDLNGDGKKDLVATPRGPGITGVSVLRNIVKDRKITISASPSSACAGQSVTLSASTQFAGTNLSYQWKKNGTNIGSNSATYITNSFTGGDLFTCELLSTPPCGDIDFGVPTISNQIQIIINPPLGTEICGDNIDNNCDGFIDEGCSGVNWTGASSNDWFTPSNWSSGIVPDALTDINIPATANSPLIALGTGICRNVSFLTGASISLSSTGILEIQGNLNANSNPFFGDGRVNFNGSVQSVTGNPLFYASVGVLPGVTLNISGLIVLMNNSSLLHGINTPGGGGIVNGTIRVNRNGNANPISYNYWSSPIVNGSLSSLNGNKYYYNVNAATSSDVPGLQDGWVSASGNMNVGQGYIATGTSLASFIGTANDGDIASPSMNIGTYTSSNLIGNPYPSAISAAAFQAQNPSIVAGALYFWSDDNSAGADYMINDYGTWSPLGYVAPVDLTTFSGNIASCQSFFVDASAEVPINFSNSMRNANNSDFFENSISESISRFWLNAKDNQGHYSECLIAIKDDATSGRDIQYDAKRFTVPGAFSLYTSIDDKPYAIQAVGPINEETIIPLGIIVQNPGYYDIGLKVEENLDNIGLLILEDRFTGTMYNLRTNPINSFVLDESNSENRFFIHMIAAPKITLVENVCSNHYNLNVKTTSPSSWNFTLNNSLGGIFYPTYYTDSSAYFSSVYSGSYSVNGIYPNGSEFSKTLELSSKNLPDPNFSYEFIFSNSHSQVDVKFTAANVEGYNYSWEFGDGSSYLGESEIIYSYSEQGIFNARLEISNEQCIFEGEREIPINFLNIKHLENKRNLTIYPNPASSSIYLKYNSTLKSEYYIYNNTGALVARNWLNTSSGLENIDISNYSNGNYMMLVFTENGFEKAAFTILK